MIDWNHVRTLQQEVGPEDFDKLVPLFFSEIDSAVKRVSKSDTPIQLARDLHFLRSGALNLGFSDLSTLCAEGEMQAENGEADKVDLTAIVSCYEASKHQFLEGLQNLDAA
ncbi:MAG: Hpt domain-containing protein [Sulfitobacter sp.]|nr:Hpt domain-containing protein [Sulfitobacter sp.]